MKVTSSTRSPHRFLFLSSAVAAILWMAHGVSSAAAGPKSDERESSIDVVFSPEGGCADRIIAEIESARSSIHVQVYIFTSDQIADALIKAAKRDIRVDVLLDASQKKKRYSKWKKLKQGGVSVRFDEDHATANNKIMLVDNTTIVTGSYNFSKAAESRNAENIVIIKNNRSLFTKFRENFESHWEHSD
ncbi:MAG: phospholipase D family protein [Phycisphaerales bacterium]|nr:phospholipase D family protein [Phycisphaerales bacterium]MCB9857686.1 phospholipase D family protein [Phycisphaerales bacterium]MCB9864775.1 phospholipase D family protein [Phycisphaerales bacterium]